MKLTGLWWVIIKVWKHCSSDGKSKENNNKMIFGVISIFRTENNKEINEKQNRINFRNYLTRFSIKWKIIRERSCIFLRAEQANHQSIFHYYFGVYFGFERLVQQFILKKHCQGWFARIIINWIRLWSMRAFQLIQFSESPICNRRCGPVVWPIFHAASKIIACYSENGTQHM